MPVGGRGSTGGCPAHAALPLLLAQEAEASIDPAGWLVSEKLDGVRAAWDGRQLRFRSGRVVAAPAWFLAQLPRTPLDGELWLDRGRFDEVSSLVRRDEPDDTGWRELRYMLFELPGAPGSFAERARVLRQIADAAAVPGLQAVPQHAVRDRAALRRWLDLVLEEGGEGLMLHRADAPYLVGRSPALLKLKPTQDAEATVLAHLPGRGRHAGRLGALRVRGDDGVVFDLGTGFTDAEREQPPSRGSRVTFAYRGRTPQGVPRFASFVRRRPED
ncbi:DNA ligase [Piscinibacter aquaticus]|uniref:DNA ligase n=1 Tax=Piscinibacter aquaticus TaxID=392597 RepID=A0A5C6U1Y1_9BURK|nr:DNA ligase [Piscinibacter aquaticus]